MSGVSKVGKEKDHCSGPERGCEFCTAFTDF